jgi:REP element-mobilizing transposase RayT
LPAYDYSQAGAYFITVFTRDRVMLFGEIIDFGVRLNEIGIIVKQTWDNLPTHYRGIDLDAFIVMPNHVHGIIILADEPETRCGIPEIVRGFKTFSARRVNERGGRRGALWQRGYYEHNNPARWADDPDNL